MAKDYFFNGLVGGDMFRALGQSFIDVFKKPLVLLWTFILFVLWAGVFALIYNYTSEFMPSAELNLATSILYFLINHIWLFLIYICLFILISYVASLFIAYVINKKLGSKNKFEGSGKVFGFTIFVTIVSLLPSIIFGFFEVSLTISILYLLLSLFYVLFIYPVLLCVPMLLVNSDLKKSLTKSMEFAKKHFITIIFLQIIFVILISFLGLLTDFLTVYIDEIAVYFIFLVLFSILVLWGFYFIYNWYYSEKTQM